MWNLHPPPSLLEAVGEGRVTPYAAVWVCVVRARVCLCAGGLSPCVRVRVRLSGQSGCICLTHTSVCVCVCVCRVSDCVWAGCVWAGLCVSLFACLCHAAKSSFASNDKQCFPGPQ